MATPTPSERIRHALTEPQHRALAVGVRRLERTLALLQSLIEPREVPLLYTTCISDIPPEQAADLRATLAEAGAALSRLAALVGVEPEQRSARATFAAEAAEAWAAFEDLHPRKLQRYGTVDPEVAATLAPLIEAIAETLLHLATSTGTPTSLEGMP